MEEFISKVFKSFGEFYGNLTSARKIGVVALTGIIIACMAGIIIWASQTQYKVLYTELNQEDATQITRLLKDKKVSYLLADNGKTIKIPHEQVDGWRIELAKQGVSFSGTIGYEVFDNQAFGTSTFVQKVNKQRALEGELIRTIKYIKGIKRARVHLSIPESSPFVQEKKPPSASVVLELLDGAVLTANEVRGIGSLVSSAVDGMRSEHVVIIDSNGKKLSENIGDQMTAYTASRIALESRINRRYETQIEEILAKVVGSGKVVAKVSVRMDFSEKVSTETTFDSENKATISEVKNSEQLSGSRPSPQGIPGARSNVPGEKPQPGIPETKNNVNKTLTTSNFNVPSKVTRIKNPTANIQNISVAVMLDGKQIPVLGENGVVVLDDNGSVKTKYQQWSEAELANFKEIVASAIGINMLRGDKLVIRNMEFIKEDLAAIDAVLQRRENRELIRNLVKYLAIGLALTLFFIFVVRPFIQWITENTVESVDDFLPKTIEELEKVQANQSLPGLEEVLPQMEEVLNPEKIEGNMLKEKITALVENNPSKAAQVLHQMIHSTDSNKSIA